MPPKYDIYDIHDMLDMYVPSPVERGIYTDERNPVIHFSVTIGIAFFMLVMLLVYSVYSQPEQAANFLLSLFYIPSTLAVIFAILAAIINKHLRRANRWPTATISYALFLFVLTVLLVILPKPFHSAEALIILIIYLSLVATAVKLCILMAYALLHPYRYMMYYFE